MRDGKVNLVREDMKIEGDRDLYNYTFTDAEGKLLPTEPSLPPAPAKPATSGKQEA